MSGITVEQLSVNEALPSRSRTISPAVVASVHAHFNPPEGTQAAENVGIGVFDKEGGARSTLTALNRLLRERYHVGPYASTVRQDSEGKYRAILLNKPAKAKSERKAKATAKA